MNNSDVFSRILLVNKPINWTSFDVVKKIRSLVKKKYNLTKVKVGHCGTLDPLASGLLVVFIGTKTKEIINYENLDKQYSGCIKIGCTTDSFDAETPEKNISKYQHISSESIYKKSKAFIGEQAQIPPLFSAIKVNGEALYKKARRGETNVKISKREITIYSLEIKSTKLPYIEFEVHCSKGTYIRSLANDIGRELGCGGYLYSLKRTKVGKLKLADSIPIVNIDKYI